jgi:C4-dicarboxylate-binding protein DctP
MSTMLSRRAFGAAAVVSLAAPFIRRPDAAEPLELRCSLDTAPSHPRNAACRDYLAKLETASGGRIKTKLFESGSLFPDLQVTKALVQGQVEMCCPGNWTLTGFVPDADFVSLPGFNGLSLEVVHKATDGAGGKLVNGMITDKLGAQVLGLWLDLGFDNWYSTKRPLATVTDLKGMKLRSPGGVLNSWRIRYFGGIANTTAWPDVPLAMSQGTFDGLITTNESANSSKLVDSGLRHSLQDHQATGLYIPMVSPAFWTKLDPELHGMMTKMWVDNVAQYRSGSARAQANARAEMAKQGVTFVDVAETELEALRAKMVAEQDKVATEAHISANLVKLVMADVGS